MKILAAQPGEPEFACATTVMASHPSTIASAIGICKPDQTAVSVSLRSSHSTSCFYTTAELRCNGLASSTARDATSPTSTHFMYNQPPIPRDFAGHWRGGAVVGRRAAGYAPRPRGGRPQRGGMGHGRGPAPGGLRVMVSSFIPSVQPF